MKKRFILFFIAMGLIMAFAPTTSMIDLRFIPVAPSISDSVWLLGHKKTTGVYTTYRFSMPQLASYLGAGTGLGNNFANADLTVLTNRDHNLAKYGVRLRNANYFRITDTLNLTDMLNLANYATRNVSMIYADARTNEAWIGTKEQYTGTLHQYLGGNKTSSFSNGINNVFRMFSGASGDYASLLIENVDVFKADSATHSIYIGDVATNKGLQIDYTTGRTKVNNAFFLPSVDALSTDQFMTSNGAGIGSWSTISKLGLVTRYNGGAVAGNGIPAIRAHASGGGSTTAVTITSLTSSANVYEVGGYVNINSVTTDVLAFRVTYTDLGGVIQTQDMTPNGGTLTTLANVQHYLFPKVEIMPQLGSTISLRTVLTTGGGSINYDYSGTITQVD